MLAKLKLIFKHEKILPDPTTIVYLFQYPISHSAQIDEHQKLFSALFPQSLVLTAIYCLDIGSNVSVRLVQILAFHYSKAFIFQLLMHPGPFPSLFCSQLAKKISESKSAIDNNIINWYARLALSD